MFVENTQINDRKASNIPYQQSTSSHFKVQPKSVDNIFSYVKLVYLFCF